MCKLLIEKGANVEHLDNTAKTAAEYAKRAKFLETADYLAHEIRKAKDGNKNSSVEESRRREDYSKEPKQTYKLVALNEKGEAHDLTEEEAARLVDSIPQLKDLLANPDAITEEQLESAEAETWEKAALKVLANCSKQKGSYYFLEPVDPVKFSIMDYFDIISKPMDLGTVKRRLLHNFYPRPEDFIADMELIWQNSYRYNGENHIVSKCGRELEAAFKDLLSSCGLRKYLQTQ
jgi:hypothetical protein